MRALTGESGRPLAPPESFDRDKQEYDDLTTQFAEMIDGQMRTPFEFSFDGRELWSSDGRPLGPEFRKGLAHAKAVAEWNDALDFDVRRCELDQDEYADMLAMARGELPNTMVVVRDFPAELHQATEDVGGYNVTRRLAMLGILAWDGRTMKLYTQSLDRSDREGLEAVFRSLGQEPRPGELLGQRIHREYDAVEQILLVNRLIAVYDRTLQARHGGIWNAGRPETVSVNTYDFVRAQHDIVQQAMVEKRLGVLNTYKVMAALNERYQANSRLSPGVIIERYASPFHNLDREMREAAFRARAVGKVFSACGVSIDGGGEPNLTDQLAGAGYSSADHKAGKIEVMKCVHCPLCNRDGVDAKIEYKGGEKTITCSHCKKSKTYPN